MEKINLSKIFDNNFDSYNEYYVFGDEMDEQPAMTKEKFNEVVFDVIKKTLELASENAKIKVERKYDFDHQCCAKWNEIDKQSIQNTINQVEK